MNTNKQLFIDDIKGLNGSVAQEIAIAEIEQFYDSNFREDEVEEFEEAIAERDDEIDDLKEEVEELKKKYVALRRRNHLLKRENFGLGNILDTVVIEKGIDIYDIALD